MSRSMESGCSSRRVQLHFALLATLVAAPAFGQIVDIPAVMDSDLEAPPTVATFQYGHQFEADVADGGGPGDEQTKFSRNTAFFGLGHRVTLGEDSTLFLVGNYTLHGYDFSGSSGQSNRFRWDDVHRGVLGQSRVTT